MSSMPTSHSQTLPPAFSIGVLDRSSTAPQAVASYARFQRRTAGRTAKSRPARPPAFTRAPLGQRVIPRPPTASTTDHPSPVKRRRPNPPSSELCTTSPLGGETGTGTTTTPVKLSSESPSTLRSQEHMASSGRPSAQPIPPTGSHDVLMSIIGTSGNTAPVVTNHGLLEPIRLPGPPSGQELVFGTRNNFDFNEGWGFIEPQELSTDAAGIPIEDPSLAEALHHLSYHQFY